MAPIKGLSENPGENLDGVCVCVCVMCGLLINYEVGLDLVYITI